MPVEWHGRNDFAEYAEVVGVRTDEVMAVMQPDDDRMIRVVYSKGTDDLSTATVHMALLYRGPDDVLVMDSARYVGTLRSWARQMRLDLEEKFGPPPD